VIVCKKYGWKSEQNEFTKQSNGTETRATKAPHRAHAAWIGFDWIGSLQHAAVLADGWVGGERESGRSLGVVQHIQATCGTASHFGLLAFFGC